MVMNIYIKPLGKVDRGLGLKYADYDTKLYLNFSSGPEGTIGTFSWYLEVGMGWMRIQ